MATFESDVQWIGLDGPDGVSPLLRREFVLAAVPKRATVRVNALGYYELSINGRRVGDHVLDPGVSNYSKRSFIVEYDVAEFLAEGPNCLGVWLGRGWYRKSGPNRYFPYPGVVHDSPVVRVQLDVTLGDGAAARITSDATWRGRPSPITPIGAWFGCDFGGERYDATREEPGWDVPGFDDTAWRPADLLDVPPHEVTPQTVPPNRVLDTVRPVAVEPIEQDGERSWLVDMGTHMTGWLDITFGDGLAARAEIALAYSERRASDDFNRYRQNDVYVCRGAGEERFSSRFNYHAFRYVKIGGLEAKPDLAGIKGLLIGNDLPRVGRFTCSHDLLNRIHEMEAWTLRCLTLGGVMVDCPHRERLGYGGDGTASLETTLCLYDSNAFLRSWLDLWRDELRPDGGLPHTAPSPYHAGGGPVWCGFPLTAAWRHYLHYGDPTILQTQYPAVEKWFGYVETHSRDGLLRPWGDTPYRTWYLGDWIPPEGVDPTDPESIDLVNNCFIVQCFDRMARIAAILGRPTDAEAYRHRAEALREAVHGAFYRPDTGLYADGDQLDLAYPLLADVVPPDLREGMLTRLVETIRQSGKAKIGTGLVGTTVLIDLLIREGRNDLLFEMITDRDYPGWAYMLDHGATTVWETWEGKKSLIHNCLNQVGSWFYRALAGICPDENGPGFRQFIVRPQPVVGLEQIEASYRSAAGPIACRWAWNDGRFRLSVSVPDGATATVHVPTTDPDSVLVAGKFVAADDVVGVGGYVYAVFACRDGEHAFEAALRPDRRTV